MYAAVTGEYEWSFVVHKHLTPCVHMDKVRSQTDILDSSCDKLDGLSHFCY